MQWFQQESSNAAIMYESHSSAVVKCPIASIIWAMQEGAGGAKFHLTKHACGAVKCLLYQNSPGRRSV